MKSALLSASELLAWAGRAGEHASDQTDVLLYCSIAEVLEAAESCKKHRTPRRCDMNLDELVGAVCSASNTGVLQIAVLDQASLSDGLFEWVDGQSLGQLWCSAVREAVTPMDSLRYVALRAFDKWNDTDLLPLAVDRASRDRSDA